MAKCNNCGSTITCGCQVRTSKNGVRGCSKCIEQLNSNVNQVYKNNVIINKRNGAKE